MRRCYILMAHRVSQHSAAAGFVTRDSFSCFTLSYPQVHGGGAAAAGGISGVFTFTGVAYASDVETQLCAHLLVYNNTPETGRKEELLAMCNATIEDLNDKEDYTEISPSRKGPWTPPEIWKNQALIGKFKEFLRASASTKAGWLSTIQLWLQTDHNVSTTAKGIHDWAQRLTLPLRNKHALLLPSLDPKTKASRLPHMLPAVANLILANYTAMDARLQEIENRTTLEQQTNHSPTKPMLKAMLAAKLSEVDTLRERVSTLEGNISTLNVTISTNESASVQGRGRGFFLGGDFFRV
jgi:hypothetical protein